MLAKFMLENKMKRLFLALGLAFAPFVIIVIVLMGFNIIDSGITVISTGGLGAAAFGILDFFLYLMLDSEKDGGRLGAFMKNLFYYAIMIIELIVALLVMMSYTLDGVDVLGDLGKYGGLGGIAFIGLVSFSWLIKFFIYQKIYDGKLLPKEALPYVSLGSMVIGYLVTLILLLFGLTAQFVIQWVPFILFLGLAILFIVLAFKKREAIFDGYNDARSYFDSHSAPAPKTKATKPAPSKPSPVKNSSNSGAKSTTNDKGKKYKMTPDGWTGVFNAIDSYIKGIKKERYPYRDYFTRAVLNISWDLDEDQYVINWEIEVCFYHPTYISPSHEPKVKDAAQDYLQTIGKEAENHMKYMVSRIEDILKQRDPNYPGEYGVKYPKITGKFSK